MDNKKPQGGKDALDLGSMNVYKLFSKFFFPTLIGMLCVSAVTAVDGIFIGHGVGSDGIAAVNIVVPLFMLTTGLGLMMGAGSSVVASVHLSQNNEKAARINVTQAVTFVTLVTLIPSIIMLLVPEQTARLLGSSSELQPLVVEYLVWFLPGMVFQVWESVGLFIVRLDGSPRYAMWCTIISTLINAVLDWLFIFPFGWGLKGAAIASTLCLVVGGLMTMVYFLFFARQIRVIRIKLSINSLKYSLRNIGYQCKIGSSAFIGEITMAVLALVGNLVFMHYMGNDAVGAFGIACYYSPFIFMVGNAIAQSAQPIISYNHGLGDWHRIKQTLRAALSAAVVCGLFVTAVFIAFPELLVGLFIDTNCEAARIAMHGLPLYSVAFLFFIINLTCVGYYQSLERIKRATSLSLLRGFVFLIPSFILMPKLFGNDGIWIALALSEGLCTVTIAMMIMRSRRRAR